MTKIYLTIALPHHKLKSNGLIYHTHHHIHLGQLVTVPLKSQPTIGIIIKIHLKNPFSGKTLPLITPLPQSIPLWQIALAHKLAHYYLSNLNLTLKLFLTPLDPTNKPLPHDITITRQLTPKLIKSQLRSSRLKTALLTLNNPTNLKLWQRQHQLTTTHLKQARQRHLIKETTGAISLTTHQQKILHTPNKPSLNNLKTLTTLQAQALHQILHPYPAQQKNFLLHGITNSGKTEIYAHLAHHNIKNNHQTLILVPEISLTSQLVSYFARIFSPQIAVIHSQLTPHEKHIEYTRIKTQTAQIIIGSRSALFYPFAHLATIIIDEEHELISYKNSENPPYSARRLAYLLAHQLNANLILASATPSLEALQTVYNHQFQLITLNQTINHS